MNCKFIGKCGGCRPDGKAAEPPPECVPTRPTIRIPEGVRRRARLKLDYGGHIGFYAAKSNDVVQIDSCTMLLPALNALIKPLVEAVASLTIKGEGEFGITAVDNGMVLELDGFKIHPLDAPKFRAFGREHGILRVTTGRETLFECGRPTVEIGGRAVPYPPGSFLQPSKEGEEAILSTVRSMLPSGAKRGYDLFCGLGLFCLSFPGIEWRAFDCDAAAVKILRGFGIRAQERDLFSRPVKPEALDIVVLDPPRAGAGAQCRALAISAIPHIIYVSCNPATFIKDRAALEEGGYRQTELAPIDQFPGSGHMELVAEFSR
jgi:23S rRNA (uracil1939-C5)-methyltransferase